MSRACTAGITLNLHKAETRIRITLLITGLITGLIPYICCTLWTEATIMPIRTLIWRRSSHKNRNSLYLSRGFTSPPHRDGHGHLDIWTIVQTVRQLNGASDVPYGNSPPASSPQYSTYTGRGRTAALL